MIIAGAGTGKTTVITERIKYIISSGKAETSEILGLTFTQKAAGEMEERVDKIVPYGYVQMWISTFHAFADRILRDEGLEIGIDPHYVLMTQAETLMFLKKNLFEFRLDYFRPSGNPEKFLNGLAEHFNRLRDEDVSSSEYLDWVNKFKEKTEDRRPKTDVEDGKQKTEIKGEEIEKYQELANAYEKFQELKNKEGVLDFADLIFYSLKLFRKRKNVLSRYRKKFKYILVDEYQDTNIAQNELVKLLAGKKGKCLTVVLDDDQSIYRFRGAAVSNALDFRKTYKQAETITLTKNYRSTQEILNRAYDLIQRNNPDRLEVKEKIDKRLVAVNQEKGERIKILFGERVEQEAEKVAKEIKKLVGNNRGLKSANTKTSKNFANTGKYQYKDIAILVRANNHADPFIRAMIRVGIPFQFLGPGKLLRQEEVKELIAYLKVLYNFEDDVAFFKVLSMKNFEISGRDIAGLRSLAKKENISFFEAGEKIDEAKVSKKGREKIKKIVEMVDKHLEKAKKESAGQILFYFLEDTGMLEQMTDYKTEAEEQRAKNIAKFFDKLKTYEAEHDEAGIEAVVDWLNLKMEMGESPLATDLDWEGENKVNILTVHSSKGLEFPIVFMVNLVNARFPTRRRREKIPIPESLLKETLPEGDFHEQEERRLFYVGMTRAEKRLYFTAAKFYGEGKRVKKISPFVYEALGEDEVKKQLSKVKVDESQLSILEFAPVKKDQSLTISHQPSAINYISYSQLNTFQRCPLQYKYRYKLRIPTPFSSSASFGISIHDALKDFYELFKRDKQVKEKELLDVFKKRWRVEGYSSKKHEKKRYKEGKNILKKYFKKYHSKKLEPIALEQGFAVKISPDLKIGGRIDRADKLKDGKIEIIDYKTGKTYDKKRIEKDMQLTIYAMAGMSRGIFNKKLNDILLSFLFLKEQKKVSVKRTKENLEEARKDIIETVKEIENSDFLPNPSPLCDFCDYKLLCPAWS